MAKKIILALVSIVFVLVCGVIAWSLLSSQPSESKPAFRSAINPKVYKLDNGIEVVRYDGKSVDASRPPVVLVHGGGGDARAWTNVAKKLAESGRVVFAFSWLHHGGSDRLPEEVFVRRSILDVARVEIVAVVNHALNEVPGHEQVDLIGRSMGGAAALSFAADNSDSIRRLAVLQPVVPAEFGGEVIPLEVKPFAPSDPGDASQQKRLFEPTASDDEAYGSFLKSNLESPVAIWEATRWTLPINVRDIKARTLVVTSDPKLDRITPPAEIIEMAKAMGARHQGFTGVGHSDIMSQPPYWQELSKTLVNFLNEK